MVVLEVVAQPLKEREASAIDRRGFFVPIASWKFGQEQF
jgi:hypothetical protein